MRDQIIRARSFGRRALVLTGAKLFLMSTLAARLYYLQINQSEKFKTLSDDNRIRLEPIIPKRGKLFDRYGAIMAENQKHYKVWFDPTEAPEPQKVLDKIAGLMELDNEKYLHLFNLLTQKPKERLLIGEHVDWEHVSAIEVNTTELPGVNVNSVQARSYPLKESAVHVLGYVAAPLEGEVEDKPLLNHEDFKVGRNGVEKTLEDVLCGRAGIRHLEVNAYGLNVRELNVETSQPGTDINLSIDAELQQIAFNEIKDKGGVKTSGGAVIVMDVETGEIIAMASTPGFDPNNFIEGISTEEWQTLTNDPDKPLINKAISTQYSPGSTFKVIMALAALEKGVIDYNTRHYCPGYMIYGDRRFHCWNERGHGQVRLRDALAQSCNVYFYKIAQDVGIDAISSMAKRFGLGQVTGVELPSEAPGLMPSRQWKKDVLGKDWYEGETINASIGQGYTLVTPLQMAVVAAQIANGGKRVHPTLIKQERRAPVPGVEPQPQEKKDRESLGLSKTHLDMVREGMERVVNNNFGTAFQHRITEPRFAMAGKTGTVQVRHRVENERAPTPRKFKNHALFIGYAPIDKPRFAISVIVEHGGSGSFAAGPVAKKVMYEAQRIFEEKNKV